MPAIFEIPILVIALLGVIFIGLFTYYKNPKSATNQLFFLFSLTLVVYLGFNNLALHQYTEIVTFFWLKLLMSSVAVLNLLYLFLVVVFPQAKLSIKSLYLWLMILFTGLIVGLSQTNLVFSGVKFTDSNIESIPGAGMSLFFLHTVMFLGGGFVILIKKYKRAIGIGKIQTQLFLLGTIIMYTATFVTNYLFVLIFNTTMFITLLPIYALVFAGFISYAIVKHRFLDVSFIVARTVSYSLLVLTFGLFYAFAFALVSTLFVSTVIEMQAIAISTVLALIMAFSFQPLRRLLEKVTDRVFYKDHYDTNKLLYDLALIMASTLRLEDVTHGILKEIIKQMRISQGAFVLVEEGKVFDIKSEGFKTVPSYDEAELKILARNHVLVFEELDETEQKNILRKLDISVAVPLRTEGREVGLLILGEKESGDIYSEQDLHTLEIIGPEAAIAIQNAKAYEEIRRFNITLQEEVDRATKDLQEANVKLQELDKLKDEFVSLASHELRTPMTAIKGSLSTILEGYSGEISKESREFLTAAYNENDRLIRLVNNLLNISRIEAGRFTFKVTKVDIEKLITEVVKNLQPAATERNIFLKYEKDGVVPLVYGDEDKVKEVVINLVGNASKFTHKGGITVQTYVKDSMLTTSVTDTGSGIAPEDIERLFKKFSQVGGNYARPTGGTGLGLYISKQIVEGLKGSIWLESTVGAGTTFYFSLPVVA